jgi:hypothetical protein
MKKLQESEIDEKKLRRLKGKSEVLNHQSEQFKAFRQ